MLNTKGSFEETRSLGDFALPLINLMDTSAAERSRDPCPKAFTPQYQALLFFSTDQYQALCNKLSGLEI